MDLIVDVQRSNAQNLARALQLTVRRNVLSVTTTIRDAASRMTYIAQ
jgi:hypothetical protein